MSTLTEERRVARVIDAYRKPKKWRDDDKYPSDVVVKIQTEWKNRLTRKKLAKTYGYTEREIEYIVNVMPRRAKRKKLSEAEIDALAVECCQKTEFHGEQSGAI